MKCASNPFTRALFVLILFLVTLAESQPAQAQQIATNESQARIAALNTEMEETMQKMRQIVNQPVVGYVRKPGMHVSRFETGWFHPGATKPNFNTVDVRTTRELHYDQFEYVTSDLNPGVVFIGRQLEFNPMTKYFYTNYNLPKKKLSEAEMIEINRLYRIIGRCEQDLAKLQPKPPAESESESDSAPAPAEQKPFLQRVPRANFIKGGIAIGAILLLYIGYRVIRK